MEIWHRCCCLSTMLHGKKSKPYFNFTEGFWCWVRKYLSPSCWFSSSPLSLPAELEFYFIPSPNIEARFSLQSTANLKLLHLTPPWEVSLTRNSNLQLCLHSNISVPQESDTIWRFLSTAWHFHLKYIPPGQETEAFICSVMMNAWFMPEV